MARAKLSTLERISRFERSAWSVEHEARAEEAEGRAEERQGLLMGWLSGGLPPFPLPPPDKPDRDEVLGIFQALSRAVVELKTTIDQIGERVVLIEQILDELREEIAEDEEEESGEEPEDEDQPQRGKGKGRK